MVTENIRHHEIEQAPEVHYIILQRRARQQESEAGIDQACKLNCHRVSILELVGLIKSRQVPFILFEFRHIMKRFVCRDAHIKLPRLHLSLQNLLAYLFARDEVDDA